ncbi:MAG: type IV secretion system protein [Erythrobacter sp.]
MACPPIITGDQFLTRVLTHLDCQAQVIGSYGYQALGQPGSLASSVMAGLLTVFIAFFAFRLLFGPPPGARDIVIDVLKIGIVLTLAFSWPAFRTVIYETTLNGPAEIAAALQQGNGGQNGAGFAARLQQADNAIVRLTELGTGRNNAALLDQQNPGATFEAAVLEDDDTFGTARLVYLAGIFGSLGLLRIGAGLLLAIAPLVAGFYFFSQTRGIIAGWLKAIVLMIVGSVGVTIVLSVQLAVIQPWLTDALRLRELGYATPSAPLELLAIALAFTLVQFAMIWLMARVVFYRGWISLPSFSAQSLAQNTLRSPAATAGQMGASIALSRAERVSNAIENSIRREDRLINEFQRREPAAASGRGQSTERVRVNQPNRLGSSYRRPRSLNSRSSIKRDQNT